MDWEWYSLLPYPLISRRGIRIFNNNHIAHNNTVYLDKIALQFITGEITLNRSASKEEFTNFSVNFIESLNSSYDYLNNWGNLCLDKWHADEFIDVDA